MVMAVEYICDGCGKRTSAEKGWNGWFKPSKWFQRGDDVVKVLWPDAKEGADRTR
jgi:hypothetical protein